MDGSGAPVAGSVIARALVSVLPGHVVTAADCPNTHIGAATLCTVSSETTAHVGLLVTVRHVDPLNLLVDAPHRSSRP